LKRLKGNGAEMKWFLYFLRSYWKAWEAKKKDTASRRSAIPSVGDRKLRRKEEPGGTNLPGTKKREIRIS
jgi:hypothetical protein